MKLKSIYIENFCGISEFATSFNDKGIEISGANGLGKTTVMRAVAWLLNGTDEFGNRLGLGNNAKVQLNLEHNSKDLIELVKKITLAGTSCYMNGNELTFSDFHSTIKQFIFEGHNPLLSLNPAYLPSLHWKEQRNIVEGLINMPDNNDLAYKVSQKQGLERICEAMDTGQTPEQIKKQARNRMREWDRQITWDNARLSELEYLEKEGIYNDKARIHDRYKLIKAEKAEGVQGRAKEQQLLDEIETFEFERAKLMQDKLNELFKNSLVYFTLFEHNKKGEYKETCLLTYAGRTWNQLSAGEKIKAGLYIVNVFQQQFDVDAPVIIDNYETITEAGELSLPTVASQVVRLRATESSEFSVEKI